MAGDRTARRSSRAKRSRDEDSDDPEMSAAVQLTRLDGTSDGVSRESDRLAKIQEKNRKAQQKCASLISQCLCSLSPQLTVQNAIMQLHRARTSTSRSVCMQISGTAQGENAVNGAGGVPMAL